MSSITLDNRAATPPSAPSPYLSGDIARTICSIHYRDRRTFLILKRHASGLPKPKPASYLPYALPRCGISLALPLPTRARTNFAFPRCLPSFPLPPPPPPLLFCTDTSTFVHDITPLSLSIACTISTPAAALYAHTHRLPAIRRFSTVASKTGQFPHTPPSRTSQPTSASHHVRLRSQQWPLRSEEHRWPVLLSSILRVCFPPHPCNL